MERAIFQTARLVALEVADRASRAASLVWEYGKSRLRVSSCRHEKCFIPSLTRERELCRSAKPKYSRANLPAFHVSSRYTFGFARQYGWAILGTARDVSEREAIRPQRLDLLFLYCLNIYLVGYRARQKMFTLVLPVI